MKKLSKHIPLFVGALSMAIGFALVMQNHPLSRDYNWGCLMMGVPPIALGGWLFRNRKQQRTQQESERGLEAVFLQHLQENQGKVNAISFSIASKLTLAEAQTYLEVKSNQLNSTFQIDENGGTFYQFHLLTSSGQSRSLQSAHR
jgi:hypothetical protein